MMERTVSLGRRRSCSRRHFGIVEVERAISSSRLRVTARRSLTAAPRGTCRPTYVRGAATGCCRLCRQLGLCSTACRLFDFVQRTLPDYDTVLLAYGSMQDQKDSETSVDVLLEELQVNFVSATAILTLFAADLERRRTGCLAAITSVAGDRGRRSNYVYGSAKGALSLFLQGLRSRLHPAGVRVITIKPGPVQTSMTDHLPNSARFADPEQVARDIVRALERRSPDVLYTPKIWRYIMTGVQQIPETIFKRLSF